MRTKLIKKKSCKNDIKNRGEENIQDPNNSRNFLFDPDPSESCLKKMARHDQRAPNSNSQKVSQKR